MSQILDLVSCKMGKVQPRNTCSICTYFIVCSFTPTGACIPVASAAPIHVSPVQRVLKHCGAHKHIIHTIQNNLRTPQLVGPRAL